MRGHIYIWEGHEILDEKITKDGRWQDRRVVRVVVRGTVPHICKPGLGIETTSCLTDLPMC
jgi:hypothetical protein